MPVSPLGLDGGVTSAAVTLFVERATTVRPGFGIYDERTAEAVVEICETVDGLPLGIELAAARMAAMSATEVRTVSVTGSGCSPARSTDLSDS